jgi:hypothetical protein
MVSRGWIKQGSNGQYIVPNAIDILAYLATKFQATINITLDGKAIPEALPLGDAPCIIEGPAPARAGGSDFAHAAMAYIRKFPQEVSYFFIGNMV